jgi:tRNA-splicing ligase RtcB
MKKVVSTERIPIKMWLDDLEDSALDQAKNLANLPFSCKHIVLLADSHSGYGMPIGGVLATKDVVVPNCVGKDISCFSGDTKIPLLDGTQSSLKELEEKGKDVYVYSLDAEGNIRAGRATPIKTRDKSNLMEITISGGYTIKCTPDHKFMLLNGSYKEAVDLKVFDSLMPFYRSYQSRDGYERVYALKGKGVMTHVMVAKQFIGPRVDNNIIHHKDDCWFNNHPDNLEYMQPSLHSSHHGRKKAATTHFKTEEFKLKRLQVLNEKGFYAPEFSEKKKQVAAKNMATYMDNNYEEWKDKIKDNGERGKEYLIKYNQSEKGRQKSKEVANRIYTCDVCGEEIRSPIAFYNHKKKLHNSESNNHKVLRIINLVEQETTYCLNVEDYHNFALSAGVFVHNCGVIAKKTSKLASEIDTVTLKNIMSKVREVVPMGLNKKHDQPLSEELMPEIPQGLKLEIVEREWLNARKSLKSLGSSNHFFEFQKDPKGYLWIKLHSGSRKLGSKVADHYDKFAKKLNLMSN